MPHRPPCAELERWLVANLGKGCLAPLTGQDRRALSAAVHIINLYALDPREFLITMAFDEVVRSMQRQTRYLAYHSIAFILNWEDRSRLWTLAGLEPVDAGVCAHEPQSD